MNVELSDSYVVYENTWFRKPFEGPRWKLFHKSKVCIDLFLYMPPVIH